LQLQISDHQIIMPNTEKGETDGFFVRNPSVSKYNTLSEYRKKLDILFREMETK